MLELLDYRRRVFELYQQVRGMDDPQAAWQHWRRKRDDLFGKHSQSALSDEQKRSFTGLKYFDYDPAYRVTVPVDYAVDNKVYAGEIGDDGRIAYQRFAQVTFTLPTGTGTLGLFWILGYGGGVLVPFGDHTNGQATYGAGRYLVDTIKGADLGATATEMTLDFNFAYHPSCAYDVRWVCPLAPPENKLACAVNAGEQL